MAPATGTALIILVVFVLPGFVALLIGERTHVIPVHNRSPFELLLLAAYYSVVCWGIIALASWPFGLDRADLRRMRRAEHHHRGDAVEGGGHHEHEGHHDQTMRAVDAYQDPEENCIEPQ